MSVVAVGLLSLCKRSSSAFVAHPNTRSIRLTDSELYVQLIQEREAAFPRFRAVNEPEPEPKTKASIPNLTTSLVKSIVGGGVLALPAAVSALGDNPTTVLPVAVALIAAMGVINAFYFSLIGKVCSWTGAATYTEAWERSVGAETSPVIAGVICLKTAFGCLAYSMILADTFSSLADVSRTDALLAVTITALAPLCMMKDLSSLAPYSLAGIVGMGFTAAAMGLRSHDGSYEVAGRFLEDLPMQPCFGEKGPCLQGVVLACTLATAFVSHYNAPRFHAELDNIAGDNGAFDTVTYTSFAISAAVMAVITVAGFATFGAASQPVILNNYSESDPLMTVCRGLTAASMVATFPLPFVGLRDGVLGVLQLPAAELTGLQTTLLSMGLLAAITATALSVQDLSLVLSVGGGSISTVVVSVLPTIMFRAAVAKYDVDNHYVIDAKLAVSLMWMSVAIGTTGVTLALQHAFSAG
jgi:amino acid permease